ncbi:MAG TPA: hypothetical protein VK249_00855 [Anaerolineales bacterium]|nr:hypothetical protein [Anaerolineales bacterium]
MRHISIVCLALSLLAACVPISVSTLSPATQAPPSPTLAPLPTDTVVPTLTSIPEPTPAPSDSLGTIGLDFVALLCNADWMNGAVHLLPCPNPNADLSGGDARVLDALSEGLPANTPILQMIPNANALFLRYPSFTVKAGDRFRTTLLCHTAAPCDVEFALGYYDANHKYRDSFMVWDYKAGDPPIDVDLDLSPLAGQSLDFVLTLRLSHSIQSPDEDNGLWIAPHIYRPLP